MNPGHQPLIQKMASAQDTHRRRRRRPPPSDPSSRQNEMSVTNRPERRPQTDSLLSLFFAPD